MSPTTNPRPLKERQREEREQLILDVAEELLVEKGYHEMSMDDIAARVGIAKGTVYLHFAGKDELLFALLTRDMAKFIASIDGLLAQQDAPRAKLEALMRHVIGDVFSARFQALMAISQNPELRARFINQKAQSTDQRQQLEERLTTIFDEGKSVGDFNADIPTPLLVSLFETMISAHLYQRLVEQQRLTADELIAQITRFFFKGIAAEAPPERNHP